MNNSSTVTLWWGTSRSIKSGLSWNADKSPAQSFTLSKADSQLLMEWKEYTSKPFRKLLFFFSPSFFKAHLRIFRPSFYFCCKLNHSSHFYLHIYVKDNKVFLSHHMFKYEEKSSQLDKFVQITWPVFSAMWKLQVNCVSVTD